MIFGGQLYQCSVNYLNGMNGVHLKAIDLYLTNALGARSRGAQAKKPIKKKETFGVAVKKVGNTCLNLVSNL